MHALAVVCHCTSLQHHQYRLSEEEAEAVLVQPQFPGPNSLFTITDATLFSAFALIR